MIVKDKVILGIDPGTQILGFGVIHVLNGKPNFRDMGIVDLRKIEDHFLRIKQIYIEVSSLIDSYLPDELAIEAPFYGKNIQSMLKLGRAQGAAISAALNRDMAVSEYAPRRIKLAITGQGAASKEQVAAIIGNILKIESSPKTLDATDALAVALCHYYQPFSSSKSASSSSSWSSFVKNNPGRIR